eukprot:4382003-Prymnesium_polylepis.1
MCPSSQTPTCTPPWARRARPRDRQHPNIMFNMHTSALRLLRYPTGGTGSAYGRCKASAACVLRGGNRPVRARAHVSCMPETGNQAAR